MSESVIKSIEVDGIALNIDTAILDDYDLIEAIAVINDPDEPGDIKLVNSVRMAKMVLGDSYCEVKKHLREKHNGVLSSDVMGDFVADVFSELNAKNS